MGAFLYADDLALLAPIRTILTPMLVLVEAYGASLNLSFLSDQDQVLLHLLCGTCQKGGVSRSTGAERSCSSLEGECCPSGPQATPKPFLLSRLSSEACYIYLPNCLREKPVFLCQSSSSTDCSEDPLLRRVRFNPLKARLNLCLFLFQSILQLCEENLRPASQHIHLLSGGTPLQGKDTADKPSVGAICLILPEDGLGSQQGSSSDCRAGREGCSHHHLSKLRHISSITSLNCAMED